MVSQENKPLRVLGLNWADEKGSRFNGLAIVEELKANNIHYSLAVGISHTSSSDSVIDAFNGPAIRYLQRYASIFEAISGFQSRLQFWSYQVKKLKEYKSADLIHIHIIHNGWFRLETLLKLNRKKPILWTIHDPWIVTGHCIMPFTCEKFLKGCGGCPDLTLPLAVARDRTREEVIRKKLILEKLNAQYHFSTQWFYDQIKSGMPVGESNTHILPFGIDVEFYSPDIVAGLNFRERYQIEKDAVVILIRTSGYPQKGTAAALQAFKKLKIKATILCVDENDHFNGLTEFHNVLQFGWVDDPELMKSLYAAADILLMPSLSETFGVMSLEAMSCGVPVIYPRETAIQEVVEADSPFAYEDAYSAMNLYQALNQVINDPQLRQTESERIRDRAVQNFSSTKYAEKLSELYRETVSRWNV